MMYITGTFEILVPFCSQPQEGNQDTALLGRLHEVHLYILYSQNNNQCGSMMEETNNNNNNNKNPSNLIIHSFRHVSHYKLS